MTILTEIASSTCLTFTTTRMDVEDGDEIDKCFSLFKGMAEFLAGKIQKARSRASLEDNSIRMPTNDVQINSPGNLDIETDDTITMTETNSDNYTTNEISFVNADVETNTARKRKKVTPKNTGGSHIFKAEWTDPNSLLFDINGDRLSDYIAEDPESSSLAKCNACMSSFSVSVLGVGQVFTHARRGDHKRAMTRYRG